MAELPKEDNVSSVCSVFFPEPGRSKERRRPMATATIKEDIDVRKYCENVYRELSEMKKKAFGLVCNVETTTVAEEARREEYFELFDLVDYIEKKLESLTKSCPLDLRSTQEEIENRKTELADVLEWWYG
jgi:hypothetical protein